MRKHFTNSTSKPWFILNLLRGLTKFTPIQSFPWHLRKYIPLSTRFLCEDPHGVASMSTLGHAPSALFVETEHYLMGESRDRERRRGGGWCSCGDGKSLSRRVDLLGALCGVFSEVQWRSYEFVQETARRYCRYAARRRRVSCAAWLQCPSTS